MPVDDEVVWTIVVVFAGVRVGMALGRSVAMIIGVGCADDSDVGIRVGRRWTGAVKGLAVGE